MPLTPNNREEHWLQGMVDGQTTLEPNNRKEHWYKAIIDGSTDLTPNKRSEYWYKEIMESRGGGGGSSDFSIANVTITVKFDGDFSFVWCDDGGEGVSASIMNFLYIEPNTPTTVKVPLYKGQCLIQTTLTPDAFDYSGGVEFSYDAGMILVTGDGTITQRK